MRKSVPFSRQAFVLPSLRTVSLYSQSVSGSLDGDFSAGQGVDDVLRVGFRDGVDSLSGGGSGLDS